MNIQKLSPFHYQLLNSLPTEKIFYLKIKFLLFWANTKLIKRLLYLQAHFTSPLQNAEAALGRCVTKANSPKYPPLTTRLISTSLPLSSKTLIITVPFSTKYMPSAASPCLIILSPSLKILKKLFQLYVCGNY